MRNRYIKLLAQALAPKVNLSEERVQQELAMLSEAQLDSLLEKHDEEIALILNPQLQ